MRWLLSFIGLLLFLIGLVWGLQGVNLLPGSFMSGHIQYTAYGIILAIVGLGLIYFSNRRRKKLPPDSRHSS